MARQARRYQLAPTTIVLFASLLVLVPAASKARVVARVGQSPQPNIVLIVTDDQRADSLRFMQNVRRLLARRGIRFKNGYVTNPLCCPSRASILTGNYSHTTRVYSNGPGGPFGAPRAFDDESTIATMLHDVGYRTGLFGKYLTGFDPRYVPPGWDRWFSTFETGEFYDYDASSNGTLISFGSDRSDYHTTVIRRRVVSFIRRTDASVPLFAYVAPHAPHRPAIPAPSDVDAFSSLRPYRPESFDERHVADKPTFVRRSERIDRFRANAIDAFRRSQIRSLQSVDRAVASIVAELRRTDRLRDTLLVFTSDNGIMWGEHRLTSKAVVYEESIGVPYIIRYDALVDRARRDRHLVLNIDLAPTFAQLAGVEDVSMDGRSLVDLIRRPRADWRDAFLVEHKQGIRPIESGPSFCAVHTRRFVFARYATGENELYPLDRDPQQLSNRAGANRYADVQRRLFAELRSLCDPEPPGFSF